MKAGKWAMGFAIKSADAVMTPTNILVGVYFFVNKRRERPFAFLVSIESISF
ncbi:hypothetical protein JBW_03222 [Pelosinus fermentans JBW45]|uniref:Uncharacterized protein n=1 Tax=Pelosinus fermentans JBW45 TaxID=1192197 RepID=I8TSQ0_9FIRM|nr:hypothetical protein JBW_03222 [Pelosinus fermentans JBW45]